jgi:hypothetical protein
MNPLRACGFCAQAKRKQQPLADLIHLFESHEPDWDAGRDAVIEASENCPACVLSVLRQSDVLKQDQKEYEGIGEFPCTYYNFEGAVNRFWDEIRATEATNDPEGFYEPGPGIRVEADYVAG